MSERSHVRSLQRMAWNAFSRGTADAFRLVSLDVSLLDAAPIDALPFACEVTIEVDTTTSPTLANAESEIEAIVQEQLAGCMVGRTQTPVEIWLLAYLPTDDRADSLLEASFPAGASVTVAPSHDPGWTLFDRVRPVDMEHQSLLDHRVFHAMLEEGDTGERRPIEHVVTGLDVAHVEEFVGAVSSLGHAVTPQPDGAVRVVHEAEPTQVTDDAWTIRLIAERLGGTYEGWNVELRTPRTKRKRRWFRR